MIPFNPGFGGVLERPLRLFWSLARPYMGGPGGPGGPPYTPWALSLGTPTAPYIEGYPRRAPKGLLF